MPLISCASLRYSRNWSESSIWNSGPTFSTTLSFESLFITTNWWRGSAERRTTKSAPSMFFRSHDCFASSNW